MEEQEQKVKQMIDELMEKAKIASSEYLKLDQEQVNNIIKAMSMAGLEHHMNWQKWLLKRRGVAFMKIKLQRICLQQNTFIIA